MSRKVEARLTVSSRIIAAVAHAIGEKRQVGATDEELARAAIGTMNRLCAEELSQRMHEIEFKVLTGDEYGLSKYLPD